MSLLLAGKKMNRKEDVHFLHALLVSTFVLEPLAFITAKN
jgi:hypothetical protein